MKVLQSQWLSESGWVGTQASNPDNKTTLALYFAGPKVLDDPTLFNALQAQAPADFLLGCSTGGEIHGDEVYDDSITVTHMTFDAVTLKASQCKITDDVDSFKAGESIGADLNTPDLKAIFVLSDGTHVNGSELLRGLKSQVGDALPITGGMAGDGANFGTTKVGLNAAPVPGEVAAIGFYGDAVRLSHGSEGGWDEFGPERTITKSDANVLMELDDEPALELYKRYLGPEAENLPGSALLFPLIVYPSSQPELALVRTIVGMDEEQQTMTFAGDVPEGFTARLMRGNFDKLVDGAENAAKQANHLEQSDVVAVLISCIGRKLLLGQRIVEEVESVMDQLPEGAAVTGFYSYGEISPHAVSQKCELHNQTMTITLISEA